MGNPKYGLVTSDCIDFYSLDESQERKCELCLHNHMCKQDPKLGLVPIPRCPICNKEMILADSFSLMGIGGGKGDVKFYVCWEHKKYRRILY